MAGVLVGRREDGDTDAHEEVHGGTRGEDDRLQAQEGSLGARVGTESFRKHSSKICIASDDTLCLNNADSVLLWKEGKLRKH